MSSESASRARTRFSVRRALASVLLVSGALAAGGVLAAWKQSSIREAEAASAKQPEPREHVALVAAKATEHHATTTAIGTVLALRSITLRNEVSGTVQRASLTPGEVVEAGRVLVLLDASVEQAELRALDAQAALAETMLARRERLLEKHAITQDEADQARAERDVAQARAERLRALIAKKTIRAPFRARVGLADVHPGQYLNEGAVLTTLQGVSEDVHIDFAVAQSVAASVRIGSTVEVRSSNEAAPMTATVVAVDARVDPVTRNATIRARLEGVENAPAPGASVRVLVPVGDTTKAVSIPVSALRKGPDGDHVWAVTRDEAGALRAHERKIEAGPVLGESVIVLSGLNPGEELASSGSFKLREGLLVVAAAPPSGALSGAQKP